MKMVMSTRTPATGLAVAWLCLTAVCPAVLAQGFALDWGAVDGSGTASGGNFVMTGTMGCTDVGPMAGGNYTLDEGSYCSMASAELQLAITLLSGQIRITWPLYSAGWELQQTTTLSGAPPPWTLVPPNLYQTNDTSMTFISTPTETRGFYRLRKP